MQKKDKEKVFGGDWNEEQLQAFLHIKSHDGTDPDYLSVIRAYRYMTPETFQQFIHLFVADGHNINATNQQNQSALSVISGHTQGEKYANILKSSGASPV